MRKILKLSRAANTCVYDMSVMMRISSLYLFRKDLTHSHAYVWSATDGTEQFCCISENEDLTDVMVLQRVVTKTSGKARQLGRSTVLNADNDEFLWSNIYRMHISHIREINSSKWISVF